MLIFFGENQFADNGLLYWTLCNGHAGNCKFGIEDLSAPSIAESDAHGSTAPNQMQWTGKEQ